jgi:hypothetical protein
MQFTATSHLYFDAQEGRTVDENIQKDVMEGEGPHLRCPPYNSAFLKKTTTHAVQEKVLFISQLVYS